MTNPERASKIVAIASGKGGVGKTLLAANLAIAMAEEKKRVLVFDADLSLANLDVLLGITPSHSIRQVVNRTKTLEEVIVQGPGGFSLIPASSGVASLADLPREALSEIVQGLSKLASQYDVMLIDVPAGIGRNALKFCRMADQMVVLTTPEPTSFTDAYALVKLLRARQPCPSMRLVVNMAEDAREADRIAEAFSNVSKRFLHTELPLAGALNFDPSIPVAVRRQRPFYITHPSSAAAQQLRGLARYLLSPNEGELPGAGHHNRITKWLDSWCAEDGVSRA
ncbi:MAG: MinD/ParA family protein [Planctomycetota bacterium]|nr:MinD/ParA family protein [Planctomycetota bacterium]